MKLPQQEVINLLKKLRKPRTAKQINKRLGYSKTNGSISRLFKCGAVKRTLKEGSHLEYIYWL